MAEPGEVIDSSAVDRTLEANLYLVLGTADKDGRPWVTPVFFAPLHQNDLVWASSPESRHSRNIAQRAEVALTVFNSTVEVGQAEAAYFDARAERATPDQKGPALQALNSRLPRSKRLSIDDLHPRGPMVIYRAAVQRRYVLVRGGNPVFGNAVDMTV